MSNRVNAASAPQNPVASHAYVPGRFSIVIPTYNHARFVGDAARSVLAQDYPDVEILVVDDGSQDDTSSVVAGFANRVHYLYQANQGLSAARNTGIRASTGAAIGPPLKTCATATGSNACGGTR